MKRWIVFILPIILLLAVAACSSAPDEPIVVTDAWVRSAPAGQNSAIYFQIDNPDSTPDSLLSASTSVAQATELHMSQMDSSGAMSMQPQQSVEIPASDTVEFKPGGLHVMLINLNQDLALGNTILLTLKFEKAGEITLEVPVEER